MSFKWNTARQEYKGVPLELVIRHPKPYYDERNALNYRINGTVQKVWIPKKHLHDDGTIKQGERIDYVFEKARRKMSYAGLAFDRGRWVKMPEGGR